jgi:hypothetical protein
MSGQTLSGNAANSYIVRMKRTVRSSDLPTKRVQAPDGRVIQMKVVQADSPTFADDILAAFRSNVRRVRTAQRKRERGDADAAKA